MKSISPPVQSGMVCWEHGCGSPGVPREDPQPLPLPRWLSPRAALRLHAKEKLTAALEAERPRGGEGGAQPTASTSCQARA